MSQAGNDQLATKVFRIIMTMSAVSGAIGLFLMALGIGIIPVSTRDLLAPRWIVTLCGVPFVLVGLTYLMHALARSGKTGQLPVTAPFWMHILQVANGVGVYVCLATIGSWVALSGDNRGLSGSGGPNMARVMFGFGAGMIWLFAVVFAVKGIRQLNAIRESAPTNPRNAKCPTATSG